MASWNLWSWLADDYLERYCALHEYEIRSRLFLLRGNYSSVVSPGLRVIYDFQYTYGERDERTAVELFRRMGEDYSAGKRIFLNEKADSNHVISTTCKIVPTLPIELRCPRIWPYMTPDGQAVYGYMVEVTDGTNSVKLPLTAWQTNQCSFAISLDFLAWPKNFPLYNMNMLGVDNMVYICEDEEQADNIHRDYYNQCCNTDPMIMFTTFPGGYYESFLRIDWSILQNHPVRILVEDSKDGFLQAKSISTALKEAGCSDIGFRAAPNGDNFFKRETCESVGIPSILNFVVSEDIFDRVARERFEIGKDESEDVLTLKKVMKLPVPNDNDWIVPQLIRQGDRVMIYAQPKEGKTTFLLKACLLAAKAGKRICYIDGELQIGTFQRNVSRALGEENVPESFFVLSGAVEQTELNFETDEIRETYRRYFEAADVVVLDCLHVLFPSSLEPGPDGCAKLKEFVNVLHHQKKTVILVHHSSRSGSSFGSSSKQLGLELTLRIKKGKGVTEVHPEACRDLPEKFTKKFDIPFSEDGGLSDDWFDPEKRYSTPKAENDLHVKITEENASNTVQDSNVKSEKIDSESDTTDATRETKKHPVAENKNTRSREREENKERLRKLDESEPGLSIRDAAKRLGISKSTVSNLRKELEHEKSISS